MNRPAPLDMDVVAWCEDCDALSAFDCRCADTIPTPAGEAVEVLIPAAPPVPLAEVA